MKVLIACEFSGIVRDAFIAKGHDAMSCDLLPTERPGPHYQGDVRDILGDGWDMMIAHPPCTHLCNRGAWHSRRRGMPEQIDSAFEFFMLLYNAPIDKICVENPVGIVSTRFRKPNQYIQPYQFGHPQQKKTGLWLKNLAKLKPTNIVEKEPPAFIDRSGKARYWVDTFAPAKDRWKLRSTTFKGIADAMAQQWGGLPQTQ